MHIPQNISLCTGSIIFFFLLFRIILRRESFEFYVGKPGNNFSLRVLSHVKYGFIHQISLYCPLQQNLGPTFWRITK